MTEFLIALLVVGTLAGLAAGLFLGYALGRRQDGWDDDEEGGAMNINHFHYHTGLIVRQSHHVRDIVHRDGRWEPTEAERKAFSDKLERESQEEAWKAQYAEMLKKQASPAGALAENAAPRNGSRAEPQMERIGGSLHNCSTSHT